MINLITLIAIALIVWGIYELNINRKLGAKLKVPSIIILFGVILFFGSLATDSTTQEYAQDPPPQDQPPVVNEISNAAEPQNETVEENEAIEQKEAKTEPTNNSQPKETSVNADEDEVKSNDNTQKEIDIESDFVTAKVTNIVDGDTIDVLIDGKEERLRLLLVDTPETNSPNKPVQPFGPEATEFAEKTLSGKEVKLEFDGPERDKYDRLLVYLWIGDKIFNQMLLEEGLARIAYIYDPPYKHYDAFVTAEKKAKSSKKGIWSIPEYVTEDGFNEKVVAAKKSESKPKSQPKKEQKQEPRQQPAQKANVYFKNCSEARAAGAAPIYRGEPGYRTALDRDGDGIACE